MPAILLLLVIPIQVDDAPQAITFDDLRFETKRDVPFKRAMLTQKIEALSGQRVTIKGYINPGSVFKVKGNKKFMLIDDDSYMSFGPHLPLYTHILVEMDPNQTVDFTTRRITVEGVTTIREYKTDDQVDNIYHLQAASAK